MIFSSCCQHLVQGEHVKAVYGLSRNIFIVTNPRKAAFRFVIAIECHKQNWARDSGLASRQGQDATTTTRQRNRASGTRQNLKFF